MPPKAVKPSTAAPKPEDALKKLLSLPQLLELAALITDIALVMSTNINDGFDTSFKTSNEAPQILQEHDWNPNISPAQGDNAPRMQTRGDVEAPELKALKADAVEFFQLWRDEITSKIVEAATSKTDEDAEEVENEPPGRSPESDSMIGKWQLYKHSKPYASLNSSPF